MINSNSNNLHSIDYKNGLKTSKKSLFTNNEDFTNSQSKISRFTNLVQFPTSDHEEDQTCTKKFNNPKSIGN